MLPLNHDALRAALTTNFNALSHGVTGAAQITLVLEELSNATKNILSDLASEWNDAHNALRRIPPEVLSMCFTPWTLDHSMALTHVSRSWRAVAIARRALWTKTIYLVDRIRDKPAFLQTFLSWAGQYAVSVVVWAKLDANEVGPVASCLAQHMNHLRYIHLGKGDLDLPFSRPAPLLTEFDGPNRDLVIPADFLGGRVGSLEKLTVSTVCFPATCPALSTLSYLAVLLADTSSRVPEHAASFSRLFELCPRLETLILYCIKLEDVPFLPTTKAPRTLQSLDLTTLDPHYDLTRHYVDWKSGDNLSRVILQVHESVIPHCRFQEFIAGPTKLCATSYRYMTHVTASGPAADSDRTIDFEYDNDHSDNYHWHAAHLLWNARAGLCHVEFLEMSLIAFTEMEDLDVFAQALPKLTLLTVLIDEIMSYDSGWDNLVYVLYPLAKACTLLNSIEIDLELWESGQPTADDAHKLLAAFERSALTLPQICIFGFEPDTVRDVRIPEMVGCRIEFAELAHPAPAMEMEEKV